MPSTSTRGMTMACLTAGVALLGLRLAGCSRPDTAPSPVSPWDAELREAARAFRAWPRVSDMPRWAPLMCDIPPSRGAVYSESESESTHGNKLYFLHAKNDEYPSAMRLAGNGVKLPPQPVGQVVVKQSFAAHAATREEALAARTEDDKAHHRPIGERFASRGARGEERFYRAGEAAGLFIMLKTDPATPDTDNGWVYATIAPSGEITAGRIQSCMDCHADAKHDRLFGAMD